MRIGYEMGPRLCVNPDMRNGHNPHVWVDTPIRSCAGQASVNCRDAIDLYMGTDGPSYTIQVYMRALPQ